jgi:hypothetical protein
MVELRKQEKEEKALRREQVSEQFNFINYKPFITFKLLFFVFVLFKYIHIHFNLIF